MQRNTHSFSSMITNIWETKRLNILWFFSISGLHSTIPFVEIIAL